MRNLYKLAAGILLLLALSVAAYAKDAKCERCGMSWNASPTALEVTLKGDKKAHYFESLACVFQSTTRDKISAIKVVDYAAGDTGSLINATSAHYLYDTERIAHSMPPFIAAFKSKDAALKAQKKLGGDYATFDQVWANLGKHFKKKGGS
jgi:nitrous oxide reductase accessory protein NosL